MTRIKLTSRDNLTDYMNQVTPPIAREITTRAHAHGTFTALINYWKDPSRTKQTNVLVTATARDNGEIVVTLDKYHPKTHGTPDATYTVDYVAKSYEL